MNTKKILTALFASVLLAGAMTVSAWACETCTEADVWDGKSYSIDWCKAEHTSAGSASGQTYYINSAEDFAGLAYIINTWYDKIGDNTWDPYCSNNAFQGDTIILNVDIDLANKEWAPIGWRVMVSDKNAFRGNFDGNNHTISNLYVPADKYYYAGLFGKIATQNFSQTFENITIENANVSSIKNTEKAGKEGAGALFGDSYGSTITNCHITGDISISGNLYVGGLAGQSRSNISKSSVVVADGKIVAKNSAGGLVGYIVPHANNGFVATISECSVTGVEVEADKNVGGLAGFVSSTNADTLVIDSVSVSDTSVKAVEGNVSEIAFNYDNVTNSTVEDVTAIFTSVAEVDGEYFENLPDALKAVKENSVVNLLQNVTITDRWDCRSYGNTACYGMTKVPYTFNGNGYTLKFTGKIDDGGNYLAVFRPEAETTFKNLTVDMSEAISVFQNRFSVISTKTDALTVENCKFIGSTTYTNARAIIFGEGGNSETLANTEIVVTDSEFSNWKYGVVDNMNGADVASVEIKNSDFTNASVQVSASEEVTITNNVVEGGYVKVSSYTQSPAQNLTVTVTDNILDKAFAADNQIQAGTIINAQEGFALPAAEVNGKKYMTLTSAITAAQKGDIVYVAPGTYTDELVINKSITITGNPNYGTGTLTAESKAFTKPVINISDVTNGGVEFYAPDVVFDNLVFYVEDDATGTTWNVSVIGYYYENTADKNGLTVTNCDFINNSNIGMSAIAANLATYTITGNTFKNFETMVHSYVDHGALGTVVISGNTYTDVDNIASVYWGVDNGEEKLTITNNKSTDGSAAKIIVDDFGKTKTAPVTAISDATIKGNDAELDFHNYTSDNKLDTDVPMTNYYRTYEVAKALDGKLPNGVVYVVYYTNDAGNLARYESSKMYIVSNNEIKDEADYIELVFEENNTDTTALDNSVWDIYLEANQGGILNRLNSADFTFELTTDGKDAMAYEIIATNGEIAINNVDNDANRYEFHYDGKTGTVTDTATKIKIGTVKFTGYGNYKFVVDTTEVAENTNQVHTTTFVDNIVDTFVVIGDVASVDGDGDLVIDSKIESEIIVPTKTLTINVDFPNAVENKVVDYQKMKLTISGGELEAPLTVDLGSDYVISSTNIYDNKSGITVTVEDLYTVTVENLLEIDTTYTVTIEGAGYRTARYNVTMTGDKTLNFWNNVKDNDTEVETGKAASAKKVTYLAGDIVKDSLINIYDLSAVVSYFGETGLVGNNNDYAKYDLNRDGKIDSKDVAYVLVSWNN